MSLNPDVINQFKFFLSTEAMVDVTLDCGGQSLKAHKIILSAYSPFFRSLFLNNPCKHPIVMLKDMKYTELKLVIDFMYCGEVIIAKDQLSAVIKTAQILSVKGLGEMMFENSQSNGETENPSGDGSENPIGNVSKNQSGEFFCFKWNDHMNVLNKFKTFLSTEAMVDVTLGCDGQSLKAHKIVLSAYSTFFRSLFLENPCKHPIVILKDMKYIELKSVIDFMYCGEVSLAEDLISAVIKTARTLKVKGLMEMELQNSPSGDEFGNSIGGVLKNQSGDEISQEPICMIDVSNWTLMQKRSLIDQNIDGDFVTEIKQENIYHGMDFSVSHIKTSTVPLQSYDANPCLISEQDQRVEQNVDGTFVTEIKQENIYDDMDVSVSHTKSSTVPLQSHNANPCLISEQDQRVEQNVDGTFVTEIKQENIYDDMDVSVSHTKSSTVPLQSHNANPCLISEQGQRVQQNVDKNFALKESCVVSTPNNAFQQILITDNGRSLILNFILASLRNHTFGNRLKWDPKDHNVFMLKWPQKHVSAWPKKASAVLLAWDRLEGRPEMKNSREFVTSKERFRKALRQEKSIRKLRNFKSYARYQIVAMISLEAILNFFGEQKSLIIRGRAKVDAFDVKAFSFDPENQQIETQVYATMRYKIFTVVIRLDGKQMIKEWSCECTEGNEKCHHMAAALIYAAEHGSSMDQPWPQEPNSCEGFFGIPKINYLKRKPTVEDKNFLSSKLKKHAPESGLTSFTTPEPETDLRACSGSDLRACSGTDLGACSGIDLGACSGTDLRACSKLHIDEIVNSSSFASAENKIAYFLNEICVTKEEIAEIFSATKGQSDNPLWGMYHKGRITSSSFGSVLKALNGNKNHQNLIITSINDEYSLNVKSIQSGIHKASAVKLFTEIKKIIVTSGGIFLHSSGLLGCSPDGLVGETDILEIKFLLYPISKCDVDILKEINSKKWCVKSTSTTFNADLYQSGNVSVYDFKLGDIIFNLQHPLGWDYHHQIQGMLHIMDKDICHVLICTPKTSLLFPVAKEDGWEKNLEKLLSFYKNVYVHNIIK